MRFTGEEIAKIVDKYIEELKVPKLEFYAAAGISPSNMSQWRAGKYCPNAAAVERIRNATNLDEEGFEEMAALFLGMPERHSRQNTQSVIDWGTMTIEEIEGIKNLIRSLGGKII